MLITHAETQNCANCPKLCRHTCPVGESSGREALTPGAKVERVGLAVLHGRADEASTEAAFACTGCGACATACHLGVKPRELLFAHRADARRAGLVAPTILEISGRIHGSSTLVGDELSGQLSRIAARAPVAAPSSRDALFAGCTALAREPAEVRGAFVVAAATGVPLRPEPAGGRCCGAPLWAAGDLEAFERHARDFAKSVRRGTIWVLEAECAQTLTTRYAEVGVRLQADVRPLVDLIAGRLDRLRGRPKLGESVVWHDPCALGRGLGRYDEPRAMLDAAVAERREPVFTREHARCSGAGGLLPRVMPDAAERSALSRAEELMEAAPLAVTGCPGAARALERGGANVTGLFALLARWLGG